MDYLLLVSGGEVQHWSVAIVRADDLDATIAEGLDKGWLKRFRSVDAITHSDPSRDPLYHHPERAVAGDAILLRLDVVLMRQITQRRVVEDVVGWEIDA